MKNLESALEAMRLVPEVTPTGKHREPTRNPFGSEKRAQKSYQLCT